MIGGERQGAPSEGGRHVPPHRPCRHARSVWSGRLRRRAVRGGRLWLRPADLRGDAAGDGSAEHPPEEGLLGRQPGAVRALPQRRPQPLRPGESGVEREGAGTQEEDSLSRAARAEAERTLSLAGLDAKAKDEITQIATISASDKAQGAQANPELVKQYGGRYTGPQAAFVERVGKRVAVQSGLSNAQGDFTVTTLNSPVENAFAIPGGYIYVTRQLLALMNSEAELASVLGHEVGHVAARHSQSRNTRSTIGSILAAGAGLLTGSNIATQLVGTGAQLYTLKYGRDQEYQADGLGIRYMTAAGYDPYASADMLASLAA